jgi:hypothetical protein
MVVTALTHKVTQVSLFTRDIDKTRILRNRKTRGINGRGHIILKSKDLIEKTMIDEAY